MACHFHCMDTRLTLLACRCIHFRGKNPIPTFVFTCSGPTASSYRVSTNMSRIGGEEAQRTTVLIHDFWQAPASTDFSTTWKVLETRRQQIRECMKSAVHEILDVSSNLIPSKSTPALPLTYFRSAQARDQRISLFSGTLHDRAH